ncbi:MAG: hypothetical protein ACYC3L_06015 [Gemmatimonadaceae bacterium]
MSRICLLILAASAALGLATPVAAQRVLGPWDDASTLRAGTLRLSFGALWDRANERYDADGKLHTLGAAASPASWNGAYDARLMAANPLVASLSGIDAFDASLGVLRVGRRDASTDVPLALEVGVLSRLTLGASVRVVNHGIESGVVINPGRIEGTMGFNPAWFASAALDRNALIVSQFDSATAQTSRRLAQCQAAPAGAGCASLLGNVGGVQALIASATSFANTLNQLYGGRANAAGLPFVPVANTTAHLAIVQRILGFHDQFAAYGNAQIGSQGPMGATRFSPNDVDSLLASPRYGYGLRPLRSVHAYGLADASVTAKARLFDNTGTDTSAIRGFKLRQSAGIALRLGGANPPAADEVFAPAAGGIGSGVTAQSFTDLFYGTRLAASISVAFSNYGAEDFAMRLPPADAPAVGGVAFPFLRADRQVNLSRTPGGRIDVGVMPRFALTRSIWLGAAWMYSQQAADTWSIVSTPDGGTALAADATSWAAGTDWVEHRIGLGGTYSTARAYRAGKSRHNFDVSYEFQQVTTGTGVRVAKLTRDVVSVRWYPTIWGRRQPR